MNILVIKQTSLGDVLHSTGHVRSIRNNFPDAHITLLTATPSMDLYRHNPHVDDIIEFDRYRIKRDWYRHPIQCFKHIRETLDLVRKRQYEIAFDLQGLAKSVLFLYGAKSKRKFVKGNWPQLQGHRDREQHAIEEMDSVLALAGLTVGNTNMEIHVGAEERAAVETFLVEQGIGSADTMVVVSPYSRRESKDWSAERYTQMIKELPADVWVLVTGSADRANDIQSLVTSSGRRQTLALAGELNLLEFVELIRRAKLLVSGDSFPMHLAAAVGTPLVSLFGPTDEHRVGPRGKAESIILRADDCNRCDSRRGCEFRCLEGIAATTVAAEAVRIIKRRRS